MEIDSILTGKRGVSLPFSDECRLISENRHQFNKLTEFIYEYGKNNGWKHVELRGGEDWLAGSLVKDYHYTHSIDLNKDLNRIFTAFKSNVKRNIKRAEKEQLEVAIGNSWNTMKVFYKLNCVTRKRHGLPPQPLLFFRNIYENIILKQKGIILIALYHRKIIAGAIFFNFKNNAIYKYGASDKDFQKYRPNNLVIWEAIKWYYHRDFKSFSFGRSGPQNKGLLQFKRGWGTQEKKLHYYKYDLRKDCFAFNEADFKTSYGIFRHMPLPLLRITGKILYRHVG